MSIFIFNLYLQIEYDKKSLKYLKNISMNISWFLYLPKKNFILLCTGPNGIHLQPYYIQDANFNKLPRLERMFCVNVRRPIFFCEFRSRYWRLFLFIFYFFSRQFTFSEGWKTRYNIGTRCYACFLLRPNKGLDFSTFPK